MGIICKKMGDVWRVIDAARATFFFSAHHVQLLFLARRRNFLQILIVFAPFGISAFVHLLLLLCWHGPENVLLLLSLRSWIFF